MVSVPKSLLEEVLAAAEMNSWTVEGDRAFSGCDHAECKDERRKIDELRQLAGIKPNTP